MSTLFGILIALTISYAAIPIALLVLKPDDLGIAAAMRVLPDNTRSSPDWPATEACRCPPAPIWALAGYLASASVRECLLSAERGR